MGSSLTSCSIVLEFAAVLCNGRPVSWWTERRSSEPVAVNRLHWLRNIGVPQGSVNGSNGFIEYTEDATYHLAKHDQAHHLMIYKECCIAHLLTFHRRCRISVTASLTSVIVECPRAYSWTETRPNCFCLVLLAASRKYRWAVTSCRRAPVSSNQPTLFEALEWCWTPNWQCATTFLEQHRPAFSIYVGCVRFVIYLVVTSQSSWSLH